MRQSFSDNLSSTLLTLTKDKRALASSLLSWMILANGEAEPDDNVILFGFEAKNPIPVLVAKVPRLPKNEWMLKVEYDRLSDAWKCLGSEAASRLPEPLAFLRLQDQPVLVMAHVQGRSLLRTSQKNFWKDETLVRELFVDAARSLRELNDITASPIQKETDVLSNFLPKIETFKQLMSFSENEEHALNDLSVYVEAQSVSAKNKILMQGDFWHGNLMRGSVHGKLMFLDWQYSRWSTDASLDVFMFLLAGALANVKRRSDLERAKDTVEVLLKWRTNLIPEYLSSYGTPLGYSVFPARYGMLMCCIEKAVRSVMDFGYNQRGDSTWAALFSELVKLYDTGGFYDGI